MAFRLGAGRPKLVLTVAAAVAALLLAGCETTSLARDPRIVDGVAAAKADGAALFTALQSAPPGCTASANAGPLGKVADDLTALKAAADSAPGNRFSQQGFARLQSSYGAFRQGVQAGGARCTPAAIVNDYSVSFGKALDDLAAYEQKKREPKP